LLWYCNYYGLKMFWLTTTQHCKFYWHRIHCIVRENCIYSYLKIILWRFSANYYLTMKYRGVLKTYTMCVSKCIRCGQRYLLVTENRLNVKLTVSSKSAVIHKWYVVHYALSVERFWKLRITAAARSQWSLTPVDRSWKI